MGETVGPDANLSESVDYERPKFMVEPPDVVAQLRHFERGGTVMNPKALLRKAIDEIETLRRGGPWVAHVESQRAMKRERDGACICPYDGPHEFCPWHGRSYQELLGIIDQQAARLAEAGA